MSHWHPTVVCSALGGNGPATCIIECDNATGEHVGHLQYCALHQSHSNQGVSDAALFKQTQLDSMRWARTLETLREQFPDGQFAVSFKDDHSIETKVIDSGSATVLDIDAAVSKAVANCKIIARLRTEFAATAKGRALVDKPVAVR